MGVLAAVLVYVTSNILHIGKKTLDLVYGSFIINWRISISIMHL